MGSCHRASATINPGWRRSFLKDRKVRKKEYRQDCFLRANRTHRYACFLLWPWPWRPDLDIRPDLNILKIYLCSMHTKNKVSRLRLFTRTWLHYVRVCAIENPSVVVVCNVRAPYLGSWNVRQYFFAILHLSHALTSMPKFYGHRPRGTPPSGALNDKGVAK